MLRPFVSTLPRYPAPGAVTLHVFAPATPNRWLVSTLHEHPLVLEVTASSSGEARMRASAKLGIAACLLDALIVALRDRDTAAFYATVTRMKEFGNRKVN